MGKGGVREESCGYEMDERVWVDDKGLSSWWIVYVERMGEGF